MTEIAIQARQVSKSFHRTRTSFVSLFKEAVSGHQVNTSLLHALRNISFDIAKGERIGLIGNNGAGKSTLLKVLAGLLQPNHGRVSVEGSVVLLGGYGTGMVEELTVTENIFLYGAVYGMERETIAAHLQDIIDWAELQEFSGMKLKHLSSGMRSRLAFSTTRYFEADIFLLDEALAAGDKSFREKCDQVFENHMKSRKTFVISSHNLEFVRKFCQKTLWLHKGNMMAFDDTEQVLLQYTESQPSPPIPITGHRFHKRATSATSSGQRKLVIIGGPPRSGTTLTCRLVNAHSQIAILAPEFKFFDHLQKGHDVQTILSNEKAQRWKLNLTDLYQQAPQDAYTETLIRYTDAAGKSIAGEKTPYNEFYYDLIQEWCTAFDLKFIHVVRHPLDTIASDKHALFRQDERGRMSIKDITYLAKTWQRSAALGLARAYRQPSGYYLLQYEDLVRQTVNTVQDLCAFLEVDIEAGMFTFRETPCRDGLKGNSSFPPQDIKAPAAHGDVYQPESRRHFLTVEEQRIITDTCGELAHALGYQTDEDARHPPEMARLNRRLAEHYRTRQTL